jgi:hypothetical protein
VVSHLIVQCGAGKLPGAHRVADLYTGPLWSTLRRVERESGIAREVHVLSARYGIVQMDKVVESYDAQAVDRVTEAHHVHVTELVRMVEAQGWRNCRVDFVGSALYAKVLEDAGCIVTRLESRGIGYQRAALAKALT